VSESQGAREVALVERLGEARSAILAEVQKVIVGQEDVIEQLLICLFADGHGLLVGVPGLAKTLLVRTLAEILDLRSNRIQFTPDLMPSDVTGSDVLVDDAATGARSFRFVPGPIFTNILLADEINRTPPKTQAALLQSMAEREVTAGGKTHVLDAPYLVFATQNPIEQEGTYPLPEAQLDRFLLEIVVDYPSAEEEVTIVKRTTAPRSGVPTRVLEKPTILELQALVPRIPVADHVVQYAVSLVRATRPADPTCPSELAALIDFGAGPRASQSLVLAAKARAALHGRFVAELADIEAVSRPVLRHRVLPSFLARAEARDVDSILTRLFELVPRA
jgi:MoxR-like ATPase